MNKNMNNNNDFFNLFNQTFNTFMNNNNFIDSIVNSVLNSNFIENLAQSFENYNNENGNVIKVNMKDQNNRYLIEGYFPGIERKDLIIDYKNSYIYLNVKKKQVFSNGYNMFMAVMNFEDDFKREFFVPNADITRLRVSYKNYRLRLEIPKYKEQIVGKTSESLLENENNIIDVDYKEE